MIYRLIALMFLALGMTLGFVFLKASGVILDWQIYLGFGVPTLAGLLFAIAWWRQASAR